MVYLLADSPLSCLVSPSLFRRTHCWFRPIMLRLEVTLSQAWLVSSSPPDGPEEITAAALTGEGLTARPRTRERGPGEGVERRGSAWGWWRGFWKRWRVRRGGFKHRKEWETTKECAVVSSDCFCIKWKIQRQASIKKDGCRKINRADLECKTKLKSSIPEKKNTFSRVKLYKKWEKSVRERWGSASYNVDASYFWWNEKDFDGV